MSNLTWLILFSWICSLVKCAYNGPSENLLYTPQLALEDHSGTKSGADLLLSKVGTAFGMGGGVYLGIQAARVLNRLLKGQNNDNNNTLIESIRVDQEELWRVVHRIYNDNIAGFENSTRRSNIDVEKLKDTISDLTLKLSALEEKVSAVWDQKTEISQSSSTAESLANENMQRETLRLTGLVNSLKDTVQNMLQSHDDSITAKLMKYSSEMKTLLETSASNGVGKSKSNKKSI